MNQSEFQNQVNRLAETFGKGAYGAERVRLIWRAVQYLSPEWMADTVDEFIGNLRHAPLMPEFSEKISIERERTLSRERHEAQGKPWSPSWACGDCKDMGVWLAKNSKQPGAGVYAFRCACSRGDSDSRKAIPQFKQAHIDEGFYFYEVRK